MAGILSGNGTSGGILSGAGEKKRGGILSGLGIDLMSPQAQMGLAFASNIISTKPPGSTFDGVGQAAQNAQVMQARNQEMEAAERERQESEQQRNMTRELFSAEAPDLLPWLDAGQGQMAWQEFQRRKSPQGGLDPTSAMQEYQFAVGQGYDGSFADWKGGGGGQSSGLGTTIYTLRGPNGEVVPAQVSQSGALVPSQIPEGYNFDPGALNAERAAGNVTGKGSGQAALDLPTAISDAQKVAIQIEDLKSHPGIDAIFGKTLGVIPNQWGPTFPGTDKANAMARIEQMSGNAFLNGRQLLKGGGAITDMESNKAEAAFARLSTAQTKEEFIKGLDEFNQALMTGVAKLQAQASGTVQSANFGAVSGGGVTPSGLRFEVLD